MLSGNRHVGSNPTLSAISKLFREGHDECGESSEMVVVYADGQVSDVQPIPHDSRKQRAVTLTRLARSWRTRRGFGRLATIPDPSL